MRDIPRADSCRPSSRHARRDRRRALVLAALAAASMLPVGEASAAPRRPCPEAPVADGRGPGCPRGPEVALYEPYDLQSPAVSAWSRSIQRRLADVMKRNIPQDTIDKAKEAKGKLVVRFLVERQGYVTLLSVEQSSGEQLVDRSIMRLVERASPLPRAPGIVPGDAFCFAAPVVVASPPEVSVAPTTCPP